MTKSYEKICSTLKDTSELAHEFAKLIEKDGCFINLYGEIGAGKTAFVKEVAKAIGITEKVTSPSFVILNEYHSANIPVYHFILIVFVALSTTITSSMISLRIPSSRSAYSQR